jgi:hypothetical protein
VEDLEGVLRPRDLGVRDGRLRRPAERTDEEPALHFGNVVLVTLVGTGAFLVWGWTAVAVVLGTFGAWWIAFGLFERAR